MTRECGEKRSFPGKASAVRHLRFLWGVNPSMRFAAPPYRPYGCGSCGSWHVGHAVRRRHQV